MFVPSRCAFTRVGARTRDASEDECCRAVPLAALLDYTHGNSGTDSRSRKAQRSTGPDSRSDRKDRPLRSVHRRPGVLRSSAQSTPHVLRRRTARSVPVMTALGPMPSSLRCLPAAGWSAWSLGLTCATCCASFLAGQRTVCSSSPHSSGPLRPSAAMFKHCSRATPSAVSPSSARQTRAYHADLTLVPDAIGRTDTYFDYPPASFVRARVVRPNAGAGDAKHSAREPLVQYAVAGFVAPSGASRAYARAVENPASSTAAASSSEEPSDAENLRTGKLQPILLSFSRYDAKENPLRSSDARSRASRTEAGIERSFVSSDSLYGGNEQSTSHAAR
jgi:hypothetical protein